MKKIYAMACVVRNEKGKILMLKRSADKKYFPNKWAMVGAAPLTSEDNPEKIAHRELIDEIGFDGKIEKRGGEVSFVTQEKDGELEWHIYTFLALVDNRKIILNDEHSEYGWLELKEAYDLDVISGFKEVISSLDI